MLDCANKKQMLNQVQASRYELWDKMTGISEPHTFLEMVCHDQPSFQ